MFQIYDYQYIYVYISITIYFKYVFFITVLYSLSYVVLKILFEKNRGGGGGGRGCVVPPCKSALDYKTEQNSGRDGLSAMLCILGLNIPRFAHFRGGDFVRWLYQLCGVLCRKAQCGLWRQVGCPKIRMQRTVAPRGPHQAAISAELRAPRLSGPRRRLSMEASHCHLTRPDWQKLAACNRQVYYYILLQFNSLFYCIMVYACRHLKKQTNKQEYYGSICVAMFNLRTLHRIQCALGINLWSILLLLMTAIIPLF